MTDIHSSETALPVMAQRFRGFLPVVVDVETGGFNNATDALLEIAAVTVDFNAEGQLELRESVSYHVEPFEGANIEPASLEVNGIDPHHPLRPALPEREALARVFRVVRTMVKDTGCKRAVLVGHNAHFDLGFLNAAIARTGIKRSPFHPFSCFDTATLAGVAFGQTVLRRAATAAGMSWDNDAAHSARYDTEQTARLFCTIVNRFRPIYENIPPLPQE
ncbi:ribonuclease T [Salinisphaera sp. T5B8]|uniref:ribonuclease T n=1 Tax=unclassified Salinisphaera TaxID=2649847 RepID=UPI0033417289